MSVAQQDASRRNGSKSNGPVTEEGKARSARNALSHGLTGRAVVLPHESQEQYDSLRLSLAKVLRVTTPAEWSLLDEMAASRWRLNRIERMETAILNQAFERIRNGLEDEADPNAVMAIAFADVAENSKGFRMLDRHQRTLWRSYDRALQELRQLQELRASETTAAEQNEPEMPSDYSFLPPLPAGSRPMEFRKAAIAHLHKQTQIMSAHTAGQTAA